jgi:hypothetical protein
MPQTSGPGMVVMASVGRCGSLSRSTSFGDWPVHGPVRSAGGTWLPGFPQLSHPNFGTARRPLTRVRQESMVAETLAAMVPAGPSYFGTTAARDNAPREAVASGRLSLGS